MKDIVVLIPLHWHLSHLTCILQTVSTASELRKPIYWIVAAKAIDYEQLLVLMANVKWDVKEIMSQHNVYVDALLKVILSSLHGIFILNEQRTFRSLSFALCICFLSSPNVIETSMIFKDSERK